MDFANVAARKQLLDLVDERRPVFREVARDDVLECTGELDGNGTIRRCRDEGEDGSLEVVPVRWGDRDLVRTRVGVDEVRRVDAIFEVDSRSLAGGTVGWFIRT